MKKWLIKFLQCLLVLVSYQVSVAQTISVNGVDFLCTTPTDLASCVKVNATVDISVNQANTGVGFTLNSPDGSIVVDWSNVIISPVVPFSVTGNTLLLTDPVNPGDLYQISFPISANCNSIVESNNITVRTVNFTGHVDVNNTSVQTKSINVKNGFLVYNVNDPLTTNIQYSGHRGESFNRTLKFTNTSTNIFDGVIRVIDNKAPSASITSIAAIAYKSDGSPSAGTSTVGTGYILGNGDADAQVTIAGLEAGGYIIITETISINDCPELQQGNLQLSWGCGADICRGFNGDLPGKLWPTSINRGTKRPDVTWEFIDNPPSANCVNPANTRIYTARLINNGLASAYSLDLGLRPLHGFPNTMTFIESGDFNIIQNNTSNITNVVTNSPGSIITTQEYRFGDLNYDYESCFSPNDIIITAVSLKIPELKIGESIVIQWTEKDCCPLDVSFHSINGLNFYNANTTLDECGRTITLNGWVTPSANAERWVGEITQNRIPTVSNMFGCQVGRQRPCNLGTITTCTASTLNSETNPSCDFTENFAIENDNFYVRLVGDGFPLNTANALFEVDLVAEGRLFVSDRNHFSSNVNSLTGIDENRVPGNLRMMVNGVTYYPVEFHLINNTDPVVARIISEDGYTNTTSGVRAGFSIPDFLLTGNPDMYTMEQRISQFINAAEFHFELSASCSGPDPAGSRSRYRQITYLNPDPNCNLVCRMPIGDAEGGVNVMCPGCEWPGMITNTLEFNRTTFGFIDNNNNGIPDNNPGVVGPSANMRSNYMTYKDIITSRTVSEFYGSQGILDQMKDDPDFGANFITILGRRDEIPFGQYLDVVPGSIKLSILSGGNPVITNMPVSDAVVTRSGDRFLYQITLGMITANVPGYEFTIGDQYTIESKYIVEREFDFGNANLYEKTVDINTDVFLTGTAKTPDVLGYEVSDVPYSSALTTPAAPPDYYNSNIDPSVRLVCEKWSTPARFIRPSFSFFFQIFDDMTNYTTTSDNCGKHIIVRSSEYPANKLNAFPSEVRTNTGRTEKVKFEVPNGYSIDETRTYIYYQYSFRAANGIDYISSNQYQHLQMYSSSNPPTTFYNCKLVGPTANGKGQEYEFSFKFSNVPFSDDLSDIVNNAYIPDGLEFKIGDESSGAGADIVLVPSCAVGQTTAQSVYTKRSSLATIPNVNPSSNFVDLPTVVIGSLADNSTKNLRDQFYDFYDAWGVLNIPNGDLIISPSAGTLVINKNIQQLEFTLRNENTNIAHNVFVATELSNAAFTISNVEAFVNGSWVTLTGFDLDVNNSGIYKGVAPDVISIPPNGGEIKIRVNGTYNCSVASSTDLKLNYGWNCLDGLPVLKTDLANTCNLKFAEYIIQPSQAILTSSLTLATGTTNPVPCDHIPFTYTVASLDIGGIYDLVARVQIPNTTIAINPSSTVSFRKVDAAGTLLAGPFSVAVPALTGLIYEWDLNSITGLLDTDLGLQNGERIQLDFALDPTCLYALETIQASIATTSFCQQTMNSTSSYTPLSMQQGCNKPVAVINGGSTVCAGTIDVLTASSNTGVAPFTYRWKDASLNNIAGATNQTYNFVSTIAGTYTIYLEITDANGCTDLSDPFVINVLALPIVSAGNDVEICSGTFRTLIATGAATYSWSPGGATTASITVSPSVTTTYTVTGTNANNCSNTDQVTITVNSNPIVTVNNPVLNCPANSGGINCQDLTATVTSGTPAYSYLWSTGASTSTINVCPTATTSYTATVTDSKGCTGTATRTVVVGYDYALEVDPKPYICGDTRQLCVTLNKITTNVDPGIIGMDYAFTYDKTLFSLASTAPVIEADLGPVVTHSLPASYKPGVYLFNEVPATSNDAVVHLSIYYKSTSLPNSTFIGQGKVAKVCFNVLNTAISVTPYVFQKWELQEAYTLVEKDRCLRPDTFKVDYDNVYKARLFYMNTNDLAPGNRKYLGYTSTLATTDVNYKRPTDIYTTQENCTPNISSLVRPNTLGEFDIPLTSTNKIRIERDIDNTYGNTISTNTTNFRYLRYVNGVDANYVGRITTFDNALLANTNSIITQLNLRPIGLQMLAADVNMNTRVRANDITLMQKRSVALISEYPQEWNYDITTNLKKSGFGNSLDWIFIDKVAYDADNNFKISNSYPYSGTNGGFFRDKVPTVPFCLPVTRLCIGQPRRIIHSVLLGDVIDRSDASTSGSTAYPTNGDPKIKMDNTASATAWMTLNLGAATYIGNNTYKVPLEHTVPSSDTLIAIDFGMNYDENKLDVTEVVSNATVEDDINMLWNDYMDTELLLTSYTMGKMKNTGSYYSINMRKLDGSSIKPSDIGGTLGLLNGYEVEVRIAGAITPITEADYTAVDPHLVVIPNPARGLSKIEYALMNKSKTNRIVITNAIGQVIREYNSLPELGIIEFEADLLAAGLYFCTAYGENTDIQVTKFTVIK